MRTKYIGKSKAYPYRAALITFTEKEYFDFVGICEILETKGFEIGMMGECACIEIKSSADYKNRFLPAWKEAKAMI